MKETAPDNVETTYIDNDFSGQLNLLKECLRLEVINRSGNKKFSWLKVFHRVLTNPGRRFYFWWRIASLMHRTQNPKLKRYSRKINRKLCRKYSIDIALDAKIGPGMKINHGYGIVIRPECVIGKKLNIRHGVTIGRKSNGDTKGKTVIGDYVDIGANTCIIGDVTIGHNVVIGAGSFVNKNIPDNVIVCNPRPLSIRERSAS
ncbi:serine acetyltransferase [Kosakonia cowanii]|nr:serine acetyltransferase [Kosakonia cowanii]